MGQSRLRESLLVGLLTGGHILLESAGNPEPHRAGGHLPAPGSPDGPLLLKDVLDYPSPAEEAEIIRRIEAGVFTREQAPAAAASFIEFGARPRASIAFSQAARAVALLNGRDHVIPEDVKALAHRVLRHRAACQPPRAGEVQDGDLRQSQIRRPAER